MLSRETLISMLKSEYPESYNSHDIDNMGVKELDDLLDFLDSMQNKANGGMMLDNTKTYHQANDYTAPPDLEVMIGYGNGGGVGSMMVPKKKFEMQGGSKPARNYLGKQKTVSNVPVKWQSGPDTPETELAYITQAEKDLILKKNLHGSLKHGPNTGPDGIMSLDSQGDYTRDRSPQGRSRQGQAQHDAQMKSILTGQKNIGQTSKVGPKTKKYAVPEYVNVKQPDGTYKNKYIGSGYKSYGQPSFFGNLFSRGAPGYRGIKGMGLFGKNKFEARQGPEGFGYYSDKENFGETRDAMPFGIVGILNAIANKVNKNPYEDMSEFNKLQNIDGQVIDTTGLELNKGAFGFPVNQTIDTTGIDNSLALSNFNKKNVVQPKGWTIQDEMEEVSNYRAPPTGIMKAGGYPGNWGTTPPPTGTVYPGASWGNVDDLSAIDNQVAFAPGTIKDRQLKQAWNIYNETGMEPPNLKSLMQEDLESGGQLSLDESAYSLIG